MPGIDGILEGFPDDCVQGKPGLDFMRGVLGASSHVKCLRLGDLFLEAGLSAELVLDGGVVVDSPHLNERGISECVAGNASAHLRILQAERGRHGTVLPVSCGYLRC